ncbi:flagellar export chaperone FliS [Sphingomonas sp. Leaf67]|uniref:flagellar export chaperone FliS n=1 Tax=unclassified Sphingomonas TaxID=196159 RepID=UPI0006F231D0|nr:MULTISPECIES: flagellar protein FliS [unclassified Sphingomonas]KQN71409.1 flagellar export chaperone FliS [Sphingomonas sp. Leaf62]KQN81511.1 flagellar export chaperone FliS [Sphingomonas sp. Leaf67]
MTRYATALSGDPAQTYRSVDLAARTGGADPHALVSLLYEEAVRALRSAAWATDNRQYAMKSDRVTRATAILFALEAGLDFDKGGDLSQTLSRLYTSLREQIVNASIGQDARPFLNAAASLTDIAEAWEAVRPR